MVDVNGSGEDPDISAADGRLMRGRVVVEVVRIARR